MRADLELIQQWIEPNSRVLDLGCGDGLLLSHLKTHKQVQDCGLEIDKDLINKCLRAGVNVIEQNLDTGLSNFDSDSFDTVLLTQTLQAVNKPDRLVEEMLRIGKRSIITFPNFGYWGCRFYLSLHGRMPVTSDLPHEWYNTPNIHFCTIRDFDAMCHEKHIKVLDRAVLNARQRTNSLMNLNPNLLGVNAIYHISR